ncbi:MAG TPA: ATP synthase F0 subunit B [Candidatus Acidoferrum sp.]|nr:ATP synthase F0 subunit B [Candidatus Acidoferrum sp.]
MTGRRISMIVSVAFAVLFAAVGAHAAEGGSDTSEHVNEIFKWINFALVAAGLIWLFGKVLPPLFRKRSDEIGAAIKRATEAKAEADRMLREAEQKLAKLEHEIAQLRTIAQREAVAEAERIRNSTLTDAQKIEAAAEAEIEAAERAARLELKALAANLAVDSAESLLAKQLTPQAQEALVSAFVKGLAGRPN